MFNERLSRNMAWDVAYLPDVSMGNADLFPAWLDIRTFEKVAVRLLMIGPGTLSHLMVVSASDAAGANPTPVAWLANPNGINAPGETALIELKASDIQQNDADAAFINVSVDTAQVAAITVDVIRYNPRYSYAVLTNATQTAWW